MFSFSFRNGKTSINGAPVISSNGVKIIGLICPYIYALYIWWERVGRGQRVASVSPFFLFSFSRLLKKAEYKRSTQGRGRTNFPNTIYSKLGIKSNITISWRNLIELKYIFGKSSRERSLKKILSLWYLFATAKT